ncbi:MAG: TRAM domain-containing protein [Candidatus Micrarchaeota archaeon]
MGFRDRDDRRGGGGGGGYRGGGGGGGGYRDRGGGGGFGGGGGGGFSQREAPVKSGEEYDVEITDIAAKGDGICKIQGFIIFVPGASKGERCRIRINEVRNRFALAQKVGEASGDGAAAVAEAPAETVEEEADEKSGDEQSA